MNLRPPFPPILIILTLVGCNRPAAFPYIPPGFYTGSVSCKTKTQILGENVQFSVQRDGVSDLLILPFILGDVAREFKRSDMSPKNFGAVSIRLAGVEVALKTKDGLPHLRGAAYVGDKECGEWQLKPAPVLKETSSSLLSANFMELRSWMRKRSELLKIQDRLAQLEEAKVKRQEDFEKLNEALGDQDNLIVKSKNKRQELAEKINLVSEQRRRVTQQARDAITRLNLLGRTSPAGKIVDLNRRIARRENRYFTAEWGMVVDEFDKRVAEQLNVPLDQVPELSRRAEEVEKLRLALDTERKRVDELESAAVRQQQQRAIEETNTQVRVIKRVPQQPVESYREPEQKKEWWDVF